MEHLCDLTPTRICAFHRYQGNGVWAIDLASLAEAAGIGKAQAIRVRLPSPSEF